MPTPSESTDPPILKLPDPGVFRAVFDAYPDALLLVDAAGWVSTGNALASKMLGYSLAELADLNVDDLVPDSLRQHHAAHRLSYATRPVARPMGLLNDLLAKRKDGTEVAVEIALSPLQDHSLPLVVVAIRDVGAYPRVIQAQQRARYSEQLARLGRLAVDSRDNQQLLDQVPDIAAEALHVDEACVSLLDSSHAELRVLSSIGVLTQIPVGTLPPHQSVSLTSYVLSLGEPVIVDDFSTESRFPVSASTLQAGLVSGMAVPIFDRGRAIGTLSVGAHQHKRFGPDEVHFLESLANLLAASLQRAHSEDALNHAQRLESVGQLTGGIAHDFNNLLTVIQGNLQVLQELPTLAHDEQVQQLVAAATRASKRGAELTSKLLAFSRRQVLKPVSVDVSGLLHSLADLLRRTLDQRIRIEVQVPALPLSVLADPGQLESALLNIAINARDAMPDGGSLVFSAAAGAAARAQVRRGLDDGAAADEGFVTLAVTDTGTGMPDAVKARAFEPFFTTKEAGRGTGLGLSAVYGFAQQSHGAVVIDSALGVGTTVTLHIPKPLNRELPAADPGQALRVPEPGREPEREPGRDPLFEGLRVLLVEDDAEVRKVAHTFLESMGCLVTPTASAEQALPLLQNGAEFELLLSDIALGVGLRGTELASHAQQLKPALAVLLMSGFSADLLDADRDGPPSWELLGKPFTRQELGQAVARAVAARRQ